MTQSKKTSGLVMATAAAALFLSGSVQAADPASTEATVKCSGINACKGQSECKTASNACKGENSCKGKGVTTTSAKECSEKGGKVEG